MNVWKRIISSSVIYLGVRFSFGILSNFIFYYIFSPTILLLIKRAELFLRLPVILNFGASKYLATQGIKDELDKIGIFKASINFHSEVKANISIKIDKIQSK